MLGKKGLPVVLSLSLLIVATTLCADLAYADNGPGRDRGPAHHHDRDDHHYRHNPYYGRRVEFPDILAKVIISIGREYFYHDGYFYKREPYGYIIIDAPTGAVIPTLPAGYKTVIINGRAYFYYNDVYYLRHAKGYVVVADPVYQVVELPREVQVVSVPVQVASPVNTIETADSYTVNIPNSKGTYTAVVIKKVSNGFLGPQGEFYSEFPSVNQLKVMYDK